MKIKEMQKLSYEELKEQIEKLGRFDKLRLANSGIGLAILVHDDSASVRAAVARKGYGIDKLINDTSFSVRGAASSYLMSQTKSLNTWVQENPNKCVFYASINGNTPKITTPTTRRTDQVLQRVEKQKAHRPIDVSKAREQVERINNMSNQTPTAEQSEDNLIKDALQYSFEKTELPKNWQNRKPSFDSIVGKAQIRHNEQVMALGPNPQSQIGPVGPER